jgi:small subunit ribosomal protein S1
MDRPGHTTMKLPPRAPDDSEHGTHTLKVWPGTIVGISGNDVFVELGPRMQGVIGLNEFDEDPDDPEPPKAGDTFQFTLRGQEEDLWVLALSESKSLATWEEMEVGSLVQARAIREKPGGLELKVGPLHAFMPKSQTGLPRGSRPSLLVGKTFTCEVIEIDTERQRVLLSRKLVEQRSRESGHGRALGNLKLGQVVNGRVSRVESYGAFVTFGRGFEGLIHISNLSIERVGDAADVLALGDQVEAKILTIRQGGKKIGLGMKQMHESPWKSVERLHYFDQIVEGAVTRHADFGVFVAIQKGVEGLLHNSETGNADARARDHLPVGQRLSVRIQEFDCEAERMSLSLLHKNGARIAREEAANAKSFEAILAERDADSLSTNLGGLLKKALDEELGESA